MKDYQRDTLAMWVESGLVSSTDSWPFTIKSVAELRAEKQQLTDNVLQNAEEALL